MTTYDMPMKLCWSCGYAMDQATDTKSDPEARGPQPGDISICMACGALSRVTDNNGLKPLLGSEYDALPEDIREELKRFEKYRKETIRPERLKGYSRMTKQ